MIYAMYRLSYYVHSLSICDYMDMMKEQKGKCKICHKRDNDRRLAVDHCHTSGKVRGLLCSRCNLSIGKFEDDVTLLKSAIKYLEDNQ